MSARQATMEYIVYKTVSRCDLSLVQYTRHINGKGGGQYFNELDLRGRNYGESEGSLPMAFELWGCQLQGKNDFFFPSFLYGK